MRTFCLYIMLVAMCLFCWAGISEAAPTVKQSTMAFPSPGSPGTVKIYGGEGDITVTGYNGREVVIETSSELSRDASDNESDERAKGLTRIVGNGFSISTNNESNSIIINRSMRQETDITIKVPFRTSLTIGGGSRNVSWVVNGKDSKLSMKSDNDNGDRNVDIHREQDIREAQKSLEEAQKSLEEAEPIVQSIAGPILQNIFIPVLNGGGITSGDVIVSDITGTVEVSTIEGDIMLTNISGTVSVNTVDGDVLVVMKQVTGDSPLYFSTVDGDVDVSLPGETKANLSVRTNEGNIYTDFDINYSAPTPKKQTGQNVFFGMSSGTDVTGAINGGGREISIKTIDGNVYFRKNK